MIKNITQNFAVSLFLVASLFFAQIASVSAEVVTDFSCSYNWTKNLKVGDSSEDVKKLQQLLNSDRDTQIATTGAGSPGFESNYFGPMTKKAIAKFQEKYSAETLVPAGLEKGTGFVGTLTRQKMNNLCSPKKVVDAVSPVVESQVASVAVSSAESNTLTVSSSDQPTSTLLPAGAGGIPFTSFTVTAGDTDVTIKSVTVERVGFGADGAFDSLTLTDENGNAIGGDKGIRSNHKAELGEPFVVPANTSMNLSVAANMVSDLTDFDGQMPAIKVVSVDSSAPVSGKLPIFGAYHTVNNSLVIGHATTLLSQFDPGVATSRYIGDTGVRFSGIRFNASTQEDLSLYQIIWNQTGSVSSSDLANIVTVVNGKSYPTEIKNKLYVSDFDPPIIIPKGNSIDVYVKGDILTSAVNRTIEFDVRKSGHIAISGNNYGYYVLIYPEGNTDVSGHSLFITSDGTVDGAEGTPFFSGSVVTVNGGTFTSVDKSH